MEMCFGRFQHRIPAFQIGKNEANPGVSHRAPQSSETSRTPYGLENRFTNAGAIVSLTLRRPLPPGNFLIVISVRGCEPESHNAAGKIRSIENIQLRYRG